MKKVRCKCPECSHEWTVEVSWEADKDGSEIVGQIETEQELISAVVGDCGKCGSKLSEEDLSAAL